MADQVSMDMLWAKAVNGWKEGVELLSRLYSVARPEATFSAPITAAGHTVVTAAEVYVGIGMGYGAGSGEGFAPPVSRSVEAAESTSANGTPAVGSGAGGGGGGGGVSTSRPVAAIIISEEGVRVEPIVDVTKIALAFFTVLGSIFFMGSRMRRAAHELKG